MTTSPTTIKIAPPILSTSPPLFPKYGTIASTTPIAHINPSIPDTTPEITIETTVPPPEASAIPAIKAGNPARNPIITNAPRSIFFPSCTSRRQETNFDFLSAEDELFPFPLKFFKRTLFYA